MIFSEGSLLTWPDFAVAAAFLAAMVVVGAWFEKRQTSTREFFLGSRSVPWWARQPVVRGYRSECGDRDFGAGHFRYDVLAHLVEIVGVATASPVTTTPGTCAF